PSARRGRVVEPVYLENNSEDYGMRKWATRFFGKQQIFQQASTCSLRKHFKRQINSQSVRRWPTLSCALENDPTHQQLFLRSRRTVQPEVSIDTTQGFFVRSDELARLEAALYLSQEPIPVRRLAKLARLPDATRARTLLTDLQKIATESGSAFRVEQVAGGFQLLTRGDFGPWVRRLLATPPENRLSASAMETLAVVAYKQPVTRAEIESIRGVGCDEMLRQLLERDFVGIGGRIEELGRPNIYITTRHFLQAFGLARIEDLPPLAYIQPSEPPSDSNSE
ncbi:MAG: SMC-Scp complex subunit ScpB, partial [Pirellulales bacterium]